MFRGFRDRWLKVQPDGEQLIREYYQVAPAIVKKINIRTDAKRIYMEIWDRYLLPCLHYIESGDNVRCKEVYISMVNALKKKF